MDEVLDDAYVEKIGPWLKARRCLGATYKPEDHFTEKEMHYKFAIGCKYSETRYVEDYEEYLEEEAQERHEDTIAACLAKLTT